MNQDKMKSLIAKGNERAAKKSSEQLEKSTEQISVPTFGPMGIGPRTPEAMALDLQTINALFGLGVPTKLASFAGFDAPQKAIEEARGLTGGYGQVAEAAGTLPLSLIGGAIPQKASSLIKFGGAEGLLAGYGLSGRGQEVPATIIGGLLGAGIPAVPALVGEAVSRLSSPLKARMASARESAERRVLGGMESLDVSPEKMLARAAEPSPITVAEMTGRDFASGLEPMVRQAAKEMGPAYVRVSEQLGERGAKSIDRIVASMSDIPVLDAFETATELAARRKSNSQPLYKQAYEFVPTSDERKQLTRLFKSPTIQKSFSKAVDSLKDVAAVSNELADIKIPKKISISNVPEFTRTLDLTKRSIDDQIGVATRSGEFDEASRLQSLKESLLSTLDEINPSYAAARQQYAGDIAIENALVLGQDIFKKNLPVQNVSSFFTKSTNSEKEAFRLGVSQAIRDSIQNGEVSKVKKLLTKESQDKLKQVWPSSESFSKFVDTVSSEVKMAESAKRMVPTPTVPDDSGLLTDIAGSLLATPVVGRAARPTSRMQAAAVAAGNIARSVLTDKGMSPEEAMEVTNILMASTPSGRKNVIDRLIARKQISSDDGIKLTNIVTGLTVPSMAATGLLLQE